MRRLPPASSFIPRYLLAVFTIALTTGVLYILREKLDTPLVALLCLLPVGLSTARWGLGPGGGAGQPPDGDRRIRL